MYAVTEQVATTQADATAAATTVHLRWDFGPWWCGPVHRYREFTMVEAFWLQYSDLAASLSEALTHAYPRKLIPNRVCVS